MKIREYVEVVQIPESARQAPVSPGEAGMPEIPESLRAAPLTVAPVPENLPPGHPTLGTAGIPGNLADPNSMRGREDEVPEAPDAGDMTWDLPPGWTARAGSGLRAAEFVPPGDAGNALVTLTALGGMGGMIDANITRWRGQVGLPAGESTLQQIEGELPFDFLTLVDESRASGQPSTLLAAIYRLPDRSLFLKFMGPTETLAAHKLDFLQLAGSLRLKEEE